VNATEGHGFQVPEPQRITVLITGSGVRVPPRELQQQQFIDPVLRAVVTMRP
jgi:hypothetical protein